MADPPADEGEESEGNGYRDEFDIPEFVPSDYQGPIAKEDKFGNVRRLCLVPTGEDGERGPCKNYANTCNWHDIKENSLIKHSEQKQPRTFETIEKHHEDALEAVKLGLSNADVADYIGVSFGAFENVLKRGRQALESDLPDELLTEPEQDAKSFVKSFKRARAKGTMHLMDGMVHNPDDVNPSSAQFVLERSRGYIRTSRKELDASHRIETDDDEQAYVIVDESGDDAYPDRSPEARQQRNEGYAEEMNRDDSEQMDHDSAMPSPAERSGKKVRDAEFCEVDPETNDDGETTYGNADDSNDSNDSDDDPPASTDANSGDDGGDNDDGPGTSRLQSGGRSKRRGPLDGDPGGV